MQSLGAGKPNEQRELLAWLAATLPREPRCAVASLVKPVLVCTEDRSAEVRKAAQDAVATLGRM